MRMKNLAEGVFAGAVLASATLLGSCNNIGPSYPKAILSFSQYSGNASTSAPLNIVVSLSSDYKHRNDITQYKMVIDRDGIMNDKTITQSGSIMYTENFTGADTMDVKGYVTDSEGYTSEAEESISIGN